MAWPNFLGSPSRCVRILDLSVDSKLKVANTVEKLQCYRVHPVRRPLIGLLYQSRIIDEY
jgi:hypothetical protein